MNKQTMLIAGAVIVGAAVLWYFKGALGGILSGKNAITKGTAYEGAGVVGTLGAATNVVSGGALAHVGEKLGDTLYSVFGKKVNPNSPIYTVRFPDGRNHAVDSATVDARGFFYYQGIRFMLGTDGKTRIATRVYTVRGV